MGCHRSAIFGLVGAIALVALSGCVGKDVAVGPPRMPQMLAGPPVLKPKVSRREVLATAVERANRDDISRVAEVISTLPSAERSGVVGELVTMVAREDPWRAGRLALSMPPELEPGAVEIAARTMLERDPDAAVRWVLARSEPAVDYVAKSAMAEQLAQHEPRRSVERLLALPAADGRNEMLGFVSAAWARHDDASALAWVRGLPDDGFKVRMATSIGFAVAQTEPQRAIEMTELLPDGRDRWILFCAIGQTWVARNATEAWTWARQLPAGAAREAALSGIETGLGGGAPLAVASSPPLVGMKRRGLLEQLRSSLPHDPTALPLGPERDQALRQQFEDAMRESPVRAANWLASLPIPDRRSDMVDDLARQWLRVDPRAAETWMDQNIALREHREELEREVER